MLSLDFSKAKRGSAGLSVLDTSLIVKSGGAWCMKVKDSISQVLFCSELSCEKPQLFTFTVSLKGVSGSFDCCLCWSGAAGPCPCSQTLLQTWILPLWWLLLLDCPETRTDFLRAVRRLYVGYCQGFWFWCELESSLISTPFAWVFRLSIRKTCSFLVLLNSVTTPALHPAWRHFDVSPIPGCFLKCFPLGKCHFLKGIWTSELYPQWRQLETLANGGLC